MCQCLHIYSPALCCVLLLFACARASIYTVLLCVVSCYYLHVPVPPYIQSCSVLCLAIICMCQCLHIYSPAQCHHIYTVLLCVVSCYYLHVPVPPYIQFCSVLCLTIICMCQCLHIYSPALCCVLLLFECASASIYTVLLCVVSCYYLNVPCLHIYSPALCCALLLFECASASI